MIINSVSAKNVLVFKDIYVKLDGRKLLVVRGHNRNSNVLDTNGVGKSLLFDLIPTVIYGVTGNDARPKDLMDDTSSITVCFTNKKHVYEVTATNKNGLKYAVSVDGVDQQTHTIAAARRIIGQGWPISEQEYWSIWCLNSQVSNLVLRGTTSQRLQFFTDFFDLGIYEKLRTYFRHKLKDVEHIETEVATLLSEFMRVKSEYDGLVKPDFDAEQYTEVLDKYTRITNVLDTYRVQLNVLNQYHRLKKIVVAPINIAESRKLLADVLEADELREKRNIAIDRSNQLATQLKEIEQEMLEFGDVEYDEQYAEELQLYLNKLNKRLDRAVVHNDNVLRLTTKLESYGIDNSKFNEQVLQRSKEDYSLCQTTLKLEANVVDAKCPVCGTAFDQDVLVRNAETARKKLTRIKKYIDAYAVHTELSELGTVVGVEQIEHKITNVKQELRELNVARDAYTVFNSLTTTKTRLEVAYAKVSDSIGIEPRSYNVTASEIEAEIAVALANEKVLTELSELRTLFDGQIDEIDYQKFVDKCDRLATKKDELSVTVQELATAKNQYDLYVARAQTLKKVGKELALSVKDKRKLIEDKPVLTELVRAYSSKGIKVDKVRNIASILVNNLNRYRALLFDEPLKFEVEITDAKIDILYVNSDRVADVRRMSKSEGNRFNLLLMLSMLPLSRTVVGTIILDEIDSGFSESNKEMFRTKFLPMLHTVVPNVVVVTPDVDEYPGSHNIELVKYNGTTTIKR